MTTLVGISKTGLVLVLLLAACNLPRMAAGGPVDGGFPTAATTTVTATPSMTSQPSPTFTRAIPRISVSVDTNCRQGPGQVYDYLGGLMVGETAEVIARDPTGRYWYIRNPDASGFCWVWGEYATVTGDVGGLQVFTPEPTPTPVFAFTYAYKTWGLGPAYQCLMFQVVNSGETPWESFTLSVTDTTHPYSISSSSDTFVGYDGWCLNPVSQAYLPGGGTGIASINTFMMFNPSGDTFDVTLKLCSGDGGSGSCLLKSITFTF